MVISKNTEVEKGRYGFNTHETSNMNPENSPNVKADSAGSAAGAASDEAALANVSNKKGVRSGEELEQIIADIVSDKGRAQIDEKNAESVIGAANRKILKYADDSMMAQSNADSMVVAELLA